MRLKSKKDNSVYVCVRDGKTGKSRTMTVRGSKRDTVFRMIRDTFTRPASETQESQQ